MKKLLTGLTAFAFFISACSKSSTPSANASIVNKWSLSNTVYWTTPTGSATQKSTINAQAGEYVDFRSDGKTYSHTWDGASFIDDTSTYVVNGNSVLVPDGNGISADTLIIKSLTNNNLTLYFKQADANGTLEIWENFQR